MKEYHNKSSVLSNNSYIVPALRLAFLVHFVSFLFSLDGYLCFFVYLPTKTSKVEKIKRIHFNKEFYAIHEAVMENELERISFVCQRCLQPLRIDPSFYSISEHTLAELSLPLSPAPEVDLESSENKLDNYVPPFKLQETTGLAKAKSHGFTLVGDSGQNVTLGNRLRTTAELFDVISNNGDVDHPLCEECTDTLLETMDQQLKVKNKIKYGIFLWL